MLAVVAAGFVVTTLTLRAPAYGGDDRAGNTRTGTDNTTATGADTGRRAAAAPPAAPIAGQTTAAGEALVLAKLHMVNQMEIEAGLLANQRGEEQGVESFGARLERDHRAADQKILSHARKQGIDLAAQTAVVQSDPDHINMQRTMHRLMGLAGAEFDREFLKAMEEGHRKTIDFVSSTRAEATDLQLKLLLSDLLPTIQKHHQLAVDLMGRTARTSFTQPDRTQVPSSSEGRRPVDNMRP